MSTSRWVLLVSAIGCGGSSPAHDDAASHDASHDALVDAAIHDAPVHHDAMVDAKIFLDAAPPALTVKNFDGWCAIAANGGTATAGSLVIPITGPATVTLTATPNPADGSTFELGPTPWHDTAGDTGTGDPGAISGDVSTVTVSVTTTSKCVWACCPFSPGGNGCEVNVIGDQCL